MSIKVYLSNISPLWPIERQEAALCDVLTGATVFREILPTRDRRAHRPAALIKRNEMLRVTRRPAGETIYLASLAVLAWSADDLAQCLAAAMARNATVVALDIGLTIPPMPGAEVLHQAILAFAESRRKSDAIRDGKAGAAVSASVRSAKADAAIERIKARWPLPSDAWSTADLVAEAGVSRNTVQARLGTRPAAQKKHLAAIMRRSKKEAKGE